MVILWDIKNTNTNILVTPDHNMIYEKRWCCIYR